MINGSMKVWVCEVCSRGVWSEGNRYALDYGDLEKERWIGGMQMWSGYVKQDKMLQYFQYIFFPGPVGKTSLLPEASDKWGCMICQLPHACYHLGLMLW